MCPFFFFFSLRLLSAPRRWLLSYLNKDGEEILILSRAASGAWIFPVKVQPIEFILAQECDDGADEGLASLGSGNHCSESREKKEEKAQVVASVTQLFKMPGCSHRERDGLDLRSCSKIPASNSQESLQLSVPTKIEMGDMNKEESFKTNAGILV